jgi:CelD/BcsL family acetyltransferase involved in cellulose biosynthesis
MLSRFVLNRRTLIVGPLAVSFVPVEQLTEDELAQWTALHAAQRDVGNPFLSAAWALGWYAHYVPERDRELLLVQRAGSRQLLGVAPLYYQTVRAGPVPLARRLLPVGAGRSDTPLELPGILAVPEQLRDVTRAISAAMLHGKAHWCELTFSPAQGWFEPEWVFDTGQPVAFYEQRRARACVVLPLSESWETTRGRLKRNVKESIRRSQNRLKKDGGDWRVQHLRATDVDVAAVDRFLTLHRARSSAQQAGNHHPDAYADPQARRFMRQILPELAREGAASLFELQLDGRTRASQLALHAPGSSYVHSSGFDPEIWELGPLTLLHAELIRHAIARGDKLVNFSPGPNVSKLRWSEQLWVANDFAYGAGPELLRLRYGAYLTASTIVGSLRAAAFARRNARTPSLDKLAPPTTAPIATQPAASRHRVDVLEPKGHTRELAHDGGHAATDAFAEPSPSLATDVEARSESRVSSRARVR